MSRTDTAGEAAPTLRLDVEFGEAAGRVPADWVREVRLACERNHRAICGWLGGEPAAGSSLLTLVFHERITQPGEDGGERIVPIFSMAGTVVVNLEYLLANPADVGMVVHELVHVVQAYPVDAPRWLMEGIADCWRYHHAEPQDPRRTPDLSRATWLDGFWATAALLAWLERGLDPEIIPALDRALRRGTYTDELFRERTGRGLPELWAQCVSEVSAQVC